MKKILMSASALIATAGAAEAHVGVAGHVHGFVEGFLHPISGVDHMLAMVTVGIFAAIIGGRAKLAVPLSFMAMMLVGGILGMSGFALPLVEIGIVSSVVILGLLVALRVQMSVRIAAALVGVFAVFHGFAHGAEMPVAASGLSFAAGFVTATALLHAVGLLVASLWLTKSTASLFRRT